MTDWLRVSVVVPVRNDPTRLQRCVESVRRWTPDAEIVVIDNDSDDETSEIGRRLADVWARCSGSVSECRFLGAQLSIGDALAFLDADQVTGAQTLTAAVDMLHLVDAVVLPERPLRRDGWYSALVESERRISEWSGLGVPRLVRRSAYLGLARHAPGLAFGEDRYALARLKRVGLSSAPIFHDELPSVARLIAKYYAYGRHGRASARGVTVLGAGYIRRVPRGQAHLCRRDAVLLPAVLGLKACKLGALLLGRLRSRVAPG